MNLEERSIVSVYNRYLNRGGEDEVFEAEAILLKRYGHEMICITAQVESPQGIREKLRLVSNVLWSKKWYERFLMLSQQDVGLVHVHNFFPNISPSIFYACQAIGLPVVQTLHNYRMLCPAATFYRSGHTCEECLGRTPPFSSVLHACYHGSRVQTSVIAGMLALHRWMKTWKKQVNVYIALTEFARQKFIEGGLPADKIVVKPNFVYPDPGFGEERENYGLFVGRLSAEKGLRTLIQAWQEMKNHIPLKVVGDGPLLKESAAHVEKHDLNQVELLGRLPHRRTLELMKKARFLVFPSEWYEGFPMTLVEAFACGLPVVASGLGSMQEIVTDQETGLHFEPGNAEDLVSKVEWLWSRPHVAKKMGRAARAEFESKYTAERNYELLMRIYERAIASRN